MEQGIVAFEGENLRKIWHNEEWYFSVVDIIAFLTDSTQPSRYWADLKKRSEKESNQSFAFCERLKLPRPDGKTYPTDCANTEGVLRIVMFVPSPKIAIDDDTFRWRRYSHFYHRAFSVFTYLQTIENQSFNLIRHRCFERWSFAFSAVVRHFSKSHFNLKKRCGAYIQSQYSRHYRGHFVGAFCGFLVR